MAKSDLLKQAIADARAVKETALANAKIALQEAFAPRLAGMFEQQMEDELEGEEAVDTGADMEAGMEGGEVEGGAEGVEWVDNDISFSVGDETYDYEISEPAEEEEMEAGLEEVPAASGDEFEEGGDEEDLNLESIIRELEGELDDMSMQEGEDIEPDMPMDNEMEGYMSEEDPMMDDESNEGDIDAIIEAILREQEEEEDTVSEGEVEDLKAEVEEKDKELKEAYKTVRQLKSIINEVNLLNAKLLYTNKLFRNFELNEGQKMKVIENFDRAGTTREVKLVFTTLAESFNRPTKKRVVKESYASRPVATTAPTYAPILNEGFELADRWKKLAGLL
jgi:hypothetical protein